MAKGWKKVAEAWSRDPADRYVDSLAYAYGMVDEAAVAVAFEVFDGPLLVDGGAALVRGEPLGGIHRIPRINVPRGLSLDGLALRLAGLR